MDKVEMGLVHGVSPLSMAGWVLAAGYSHVTDNTPNYGTDSGAFGERLAAAAVRGYSEEVLGTSVLAPLLHEDPRYYRMGHRRSIGYRVMYAASRAVVTRSDNGRLVPNYSLIGGNLAGSSLTNAYYPHVNRGFGQTMVTFGGAMGGAALGFSVSEFLGDALSIAHVKLRHE